MPIHIETLLEEDHLRINFSGAYESRDLAQLIKDILSLCKKHHYKKVLFDSQKVEGNIPLADTFKFGQMLSAARAQGIRFAFLCSPDQIHHDRFFENVTLTRGITAKVSTDAEELMDWLKVKRAKHATKKNR